MLARAHAFSIDGVDARRVCVEVDIRPGLPAFTIVGLASAAVREARERVRAALLNSGFSFPRQRVTANLAPAYLQKCGSVFDLALACALLAASGQVRKRGLERLALFAELSLSGELRPCSGVLSVADAARREHFGALVVAAANGGEAAQVDGLAVAGLGTLRDVAEVLDGRRRIRSPRLAQWRAPPSASIADVGDLADVRGQRDAITALLIAAAGGHNLLLSGLPGVGKTMLARRLPSIMPPLRRAEAIEVTKLHGMTGAHVGDGLIGVRPFRAPHHTISASGLVGGGRRAQPGEAVLAHRGVLFLDELSEFSRPALDALRQPLEQGHVAITRGQRTVVYPSRFVLVAATNPCPCGYAGGGGRCSCSAVALSRHHYRLSGPLLDRIDLIVHLQAPTADDLCAPPQTSSQRARAMVVAARARQAARLRGIPATCNAELTAAQLRARGAIDPEATQLLAHAYRRGRLSVRGHLRMLRVARTVADLAGSDRVCSQHVAVAVAAHSNVGGRGSS